MELGELVEGFCLTGQPHRDKTGANSPDPYWAIRRRARSEFRGLSGCASPSAPREMWQQGSMRSWPLRPRYGTTYLPEPIGDCSRQPHAVFPRWSGADHPYSTHPVSSQYGLNIDGSPYVEVPSVSVGHMKSRKSLLGFRAHTFVARRRVGEG